MATQTRANVPVSTRKIGSHPAPATTGSTTGRERGPDDRNGDGKMGQELKPYTDYPLTPHRHAKQWCKKIKGRIYYFGRLSDPQAALNRYLYERDYLLAGKTPPAAETEGLTIQDLANGFLTSKKRMMESGELQPQTFKDYYDVCKMLVDHFRKTTLVENLGPQDFAGFRDRLGKNMALTGSVSLVTLKNRIGRLMAVFRWAVDNDMVEKLHFGTEFRRPSVKALRIERSKKPVRLFGAEEIRALLDSCQTTQLHAMILLGVNCALGNHDISEMETIHANLDTGWLIYPRAKTGIDRKARLWPQTIEALRAVLAKRKEPRDPADGKILFVTKYGQRYTRYSGDPAAGKAFAKDSIAMEFGKLLDEVSIDRKGVGFCSLRHTFRTVADNCIGDKRAIDLVMGHKRGDISEVYTHKVDDERLERVAIAVHDWLFPQDDKPANEASE